MANKSHCHQQKHLECSQNKHSMFYKEVEYVMMVKPDVVAHLWKAMI